MTLLVSRSPHEQIQRALFAKLSGDAALGALLPGGVHDEIPEPANMPYVRIGEIHSIPDNAHDSFGREVTCIIHSFTATGSNKPLIAIGNRIQELLDHRAFEFFMDDHFAVAIRLEFDQILRDPEPRVRHLVQRFRITTQQDRETIYPVARWGEAVWA